MCDDIVQVHRPEVDTVARESGCVGNRLVKLRAGEQDNASWRRQLADGRLLDPLLRLGLLAGIALDVLGRRSPVLLFHS